MRWKETTHEASEQHLPHYTLPPRVVQCDRFHSCLTRLTCLTCLTRFSGGSPNKTPEKPARIQHAGGVGGGGGAVRRSDTSIGRRGTNRPRGMAGRPVTSLAHAHCCLQVKEILQQRIREEAASQQLTISVYDTERNEKAKLHRKELVRMACYKITTILRAFWLDIDYRTRWEYTKRLRVHHFPSFCFPQRIIL